MADLVRTYLQAHGRHRPIVPVHIPQRAARAFRAGANLAADGIVGQRSSGEFLAARVREPVATA